MIAFALVAGLTVGFLIGATVGRHAERAVVRRGERDVPLAELMAVDHSDTVAMQRADGEQHRPPVPDATWPATNEIPVTRRTPTTEMVAVRR